MTKRRGKRIQTATDPFEEETTERIKMEHEERIVATENPRLTLITTQLNGSCNFLAWKNALTCALTAKDKLRYAIEKNDVEDEDSMEFKK